MESLSPDTMVLGNLSLIAKKIKLILRQPGISIYMKKHNLGIVTKSLKKQFSTLNLAFEVYDLLSFTIEKPTSPILLQISGK